MPYIVHNITKSTIVLSDLRAEISPNKMLDLEKVAERSAIDRSRDLRMAIDTKRLRLCNQGVLNILASEKKPQIDEARIVELMRGVMNEYRPPSPPPQTQPQTQNNDEILNAILSIKQQIQEKPSASDGGTGFDIAIDPEKLADLQSQAISKISDGIETTGKKHTKKVILKDTKLGDLASELD